jgi:probable phosphoglycerate mutase
MSTLLLIRHGETPYNVNGKMAGRLPGVPLNEKGRKQAEAVGEALKHAPIKYIYSSPMERALETGSYLAKHLGLEMLIAPGINETDIGEWTGRSVKQCARTKLWDVVVNRPGDLVFPGGEAFVDIQARTVAELKAIAERHPDDLVACFSHADPIRLAVAHFLDMPINAFQRLGIDNCSICVIHFGKEGRVSVPKVNMVAGPVWPEAPAEDPKKNGSKAASKKTK